MAQFVSFCGHGAGIPTPVHELDADGKQLRVVKLTDYTAEKVRTLCASPDEQAVPAPNGGGAQAPERGIDFPTVAALADQPDADPFDLLCHLAFNAPVLTRRQRADRVKRRQAAFFHYYQPEAQEVLRDLLEKYASDGELQFTLPDVLKIPPISQHGNVNEIIGKFGGADKLRNGSEASKFFRQLGRTASTRGNRSESRNVLPNKVRRRIRL